MAIFSTTHLSSFLSLSVSNFLVFHSFLEPSESLGANSFYPSSLLELVCIVCNREC